MNISKESLAYHEAGHVTLNLCFGYGLAVCNIAQESGELFGETRRVEENVRDGHYVRIVAAGHWAERRAPGEHLDYNTAEIVTQDIVNVQDMLLSALGIHKDVRDPRHVSPARRVEI